MAPMMTDPYWFILKGAEKHKLNLEDLERAEGSAQHVRSAGFGRSNRWLWMTLWFVAVVAALFVLYQVTGASEATLPPGNLG
ncbi:MAG: hypothetical protein F4X72_03095 [Dehalococcoidia bacterium]|nr:hypothetical protein [Dehalococcoidia bacterium]